MDGARAAKFFPLGKPHSCLSRPEHQMKTILIIGTWLALCTPGLALAQKDEGGESYGIFQSRQEYSEFMGSVKRSAAENPEMEGMIGMINDVVLGKPIGSTAQQYGSSGGTLDLLADSKVRAELEMVDDQYQELQSLNSEIQKRAAGQLREIDFKDSQNLVEKIRNIRSQAEKELNSVLLPHQTHRLRQIQSQSRLRYNSLAQILTSEPVRSELEITDRQLTELLQAEQEIEAELARKIAELRAESRDKLIKRLNRTQQKQVQEIFGDAFEFSDKSAKDKTRRK